MKPKRFAAYRVVWSDVPEVPVGKALTDTGWLLDRTWTFVDDAGNFTEMHGRRIARICPTCRVDFRRVTPLDHDGPCTPETPHLQPEDGAA